MMWYYTLHDARQGPVSDATMRSLFAQQAIAADTLIWREGFDGWKPLAATDLAGQLRIPLPEGDAWETCAFSGEVARRSEMAQFDGFWIKAEHKDAAIDFVKQGGTLPCVELESSLQGNVELGHLCRFSWSLLTSCLLPAIALHLLVWIPGNLIIAYMDAQHFGDDEMARSFRFANLIELLLGNIATGGVLFMLAQASRGRQPSFGDGLAGGLSNWGRLWVVNFLSGLLMLLGLVLLIVPGIIVAVRLSVAAAAAVDGKIGGSAALGESWEITRNHFWRTILWMLVVSIMCYTPAFAFSFAQGLVPALEHWVVSGLLTAVVELPVIYLIAFQFCYFKELQALAKGRAMRR